MTCPSCFVQTGGASKKTHTRKRTRAPSRPSLTSSAPSTRTRLPVRNRRQTGYFHRAIVLAEKLETNFSSKACKQFVQDLKTKYKGAKIDPKDSPTEAIEKVFALEEDTGVDKVVSPPPSKRAKRGPSSSASSSSSTKRSTTAKKRAGRRRVWLTVLGLAVAAGVGGVAAGMSFAKHTAPPTAVMSLPSPSPPPPPPLVSASQSPTATSNLFDFSNEPLDLNKKRAAFLPEVAKFRKRGNEKENLFGPTAETLFGE